MITSPCPFHPSTSVVIKTYDDVVFSYPRALNLGVQNATGDVIVSPSGDATPANKRRLERLVALRRIFHYVFLRMRADARR